MSVRARVFAYSYIVIGFAAMAQVYLQGQWADHARFFVLLVLGAVGSQMKFHIPRVNGTFTAGMIVVLTAIVEVSVAEAMTIAVTGAIVQMYRKRRQRPTALQVFFNVFGFGTSVSVTSGVYHLLSSDFAFLTEPVILIAIGALYFSLNTLPVAAIISLTGGAESTDLRHQYGWVALFYVASSCLAGTLHLLTRKLGWQAEFLALPVLIMAGRTYQVFIGRIEDGQRHTDELQALQFRSIHTLALAVEAKDENTNAHLHRVRSYANALGRELGLKGDELKALDAAAILHDIGKLAVPEHIIAKPGKLTPEEFDRMKIHTVVGSSIVEEMQFPYPVAPLVRGHHEKWDGSGYPDGLAGENIPIGARILSAVDCLDAMASDRPYRRAMPLEKAMSIVRSEAGKAYDPRVVEVLDRNYVALEAAAKASLQVSSNAISANVHVSRGEAPATGFEVSAAPASHQAGDSGSLEKLQAAMGVQNSISALAETAAGVSAESLALSLSSLIARVLPHDALVLFKLGEDDRLSARGVHGVDADLLRPLKVPLRQGLAGWVAHHREPIVNGDPGVEIGAEHWPRLTALRSALAAPLQSANRTVGVIGLYRLEKDSFNRSDLGMLDLLIPRLGDCLAAAGEQADDVDRLKQLGQAVSTTDSTPHLLVRIELEGNASGKATDACNRILRDALPHGAVFLELRPNQIAVLAKRSLAGALLQPLNDASNEIAAKHGARLLMGASVYELGTPLETVLADAERALKQARESGSSQSLMDLHSALAEPAARVERTPGVYDSQA